MMEGWETQLYSNKKVGFDSHSPQEWKLFTHAVFTSKERSHQKGSKESTGIGLGLWQDNVRRGGLGCSGSQDYALYVLSEDFFFHVKLESVKRI